MLECWLLKRHWHLTLLSRKVLEQEWPLALVWKWPLALVWKWPLALELKWPLALELK
jgi:hypothetical protein